MVKLQSVNREIRSESCQWEYATDKQDRQIRIRLLVGPHVGLCYFL